MFKKILVASILFLSIVSFSNTAGAAVQITNPLGYYQIADGKMTINVNFPSIFTINVTLPKLAVIQSQVKGCFVFLYWNGYEYQDFGAFGIYFPGDFSDIIPIPLPISSDAPTWVGEWELTGPGKFKIVPIAQDADGKYYTLNDLSDLEDYINELLSKQSGLISMITVQVTKYSFTGSMDTKDKLKLNLALEISVDAIVTNGTIKLSGSFSTSKGTADPPEPPAGILLAPNRRVNASSNGLANWVVDILKKLPLENMVPAH